MLLPAAAAAAWPARSPSYKSCFSAPGPTTPRPALAPRRWQRSSRPCSRGGWAGKREESIAQLDRQGLGAPPAISGSFTAAATTAATTATTASTAATTAATTDASAGLSRASAIASASASASTSRSAEDLEAIAELEQWLREVSKIKKNAHSYSELLFDHNGDSPERCAAKIKNRPGWLASVGVDDEEEAEAIEGACLRLSEGK